jgi:hypothetical protein
MGDLSSPVPLLASWQLGSYANRVAPTVEIGTRKGTASSLIQSSVALTDHPSFYERLARHAVPPVIGAASPS